MVFGDHFGVETKKKMGSFRGRGHFGECKDLLFLGMLTSGQLGLYTRECG